MTDPSPQQEDFILHLITSTDNLSLRAGAGTGKTTTMVMGVAALPSQPTLCVAFNRRIANELSARMPKHAECRTMNGLGHKLWMRKVGRLNLEEKKSWSLVNKMFEFGKFPDWSRAIGLAKSAGLVPASAFGIQPSWINDDQEKWEDLFETYDVDSGAIPEPEAIDMLRLGLCSSIEQAWNKTIDYDDQLYMPAVFGFSPPSYDCVLVDEAQDLNEIQARLIKRLRSPRLVIVGDPRQAIYGFRGAMATAMQDIERNYQMNVLPLNLSFRCPKSVVREANRYVPDFYAHETNIDGEVGSFRGDLAAIARPSVILCRNTKPLLPLCYALIKRRIGASILGSDTAKGLARLVKKAGPHKNIGEAREAVWRYAKQEEGHYLKKGKEDKANRILEQADVLDVIMSNLKDGEPMESLDTELRSLFKDGLSSVTLSTIHKAKGLEWDTVYFLDPHLIPSPWARQPWELEQERNLAYVAITRAKERLFYMNSTEVR